MRTEDIIEAAVQAKRVMYLMDTDTKNRALELMAEALEKNADYILSENALDLEDAKGKITDVMLDRLMLNPVRIRSMADGIREVALLPDPVGTVLEERTTKDGLLLKKISVPLGVIAIIYESRPNVTSDAAALCIKSGNACILRGGKEAYRSSHAVVKVMREALAGAGISPDIVSVLDDTSRDGALTLMKANGKIDLLIPRGGAGLIKSCVENASVPCIETGTGICHVYVDRSADFEKALRIINNAKTQRPSVCNAEEVLLVDDDIAEEFLPLVQELLVEDRMQKGEIPVELRLCEKAASIITGRTAAEGDFDTEFLDYILAVKVVKDVREACEHIAEHSTGHSEAIIAKDPEAIDYFTSAVDSAAVYVNASTRFTDGGVYGLGCEMGISTQKLHARGPMGLKELTSYKYVITGDGHIRQ